MAKQKRLFQGMNYREVQRKNSGSRSHLSRENQNWLKQNGYRNAGWDNVIALFQKIETLLEVEELAELSLDQLFLEVDRIGNKYQTAEEIESFNIKLSQEVSEIVEEVDRQFPDTEIEVIDFSRTAASPKRR